MTPPRLLPWADALPQPWRNGGGLTRELLSWPPGGAWQLRLSVAEIERSGPFSAFPGVTRWFAVLAGQGVELTLPGGGLLLRCGDAPVTFDGADTPACRLVDGPTQDLNLMLRGARGGLWPARADTAWCPVDRQCGLFAGQPLQVHVGEAQALHIPAMTLCWWSQAPDRLGIDARPAGSSGAVGQCAAWWIGFTPLSEDTSR